VVLPAKPNCVQFQCKGTRRETRALRFYLLRLRSAGESVIDDRNDRRNVANDDGSTIVEQNIARELRNFFSVCASKPLA